MKGFEGESTGNNKDGSKSGATVTPPSLGQIWPSVVPHLCYSVVLAHRRVASPPSDRHKSGFVQWKSAGAVQGIRQVGSLRPGGSSWLEKHFAGQVRIPTTKKVDLSRWHGDCGRVDPWLSKIGVFSPRRGKRRKGYALHRQSHMMVLAFPPAYDHL